MAIGSVLTLFNTGTQVLRRTGDKAPSFNSLIFPLDKFDRTRQTLTSPKKIYIKEYMNNVPELTALINMVAGDMSQKSFFEPVNVKDSGRNRVQRANKFAADVDMRKQDFSTMVDVLVTGEGYAWIGQLVKKQVENLTKESLKRRGLPTTKEMVALSMKANFPDEDLVRPTRYRQVASSTMENLYDETKIVGYKQLVGSLEKLYDPEEIIRYVFYDIDSRVEGFTSVRTMLTQLQLIWFMWKNNQSLAKNGGQPDRLYSVEDIDINHSAFKRIEKELQKYHNVENRHGSLLLNGKVTVNDLAQLDTMQFSEMGLYITGLIAMQWRIPRSRIPYISKEANTKDDTGGNSEKSYWQNISFLQDLYLDTQNKQLWEPYFGVRRRFDKGYKHDDLIEAQTKQTNLNNLVLQSNEIGKQGYRFKKNYILRYINGGDQTLFEDDIEKIPKDEQMMMMGGNPQGFMQQGMNRDQLETGKDKQNIKDAKRTEQDRLSAVRGKPTGFGKEHSLKYMLEKKEVQRVGFLKFINLYNEDKAFNKEPPRVFMSNNSDGISRFVYKSTDFVYESFVPTTEISKVQLMNFRRLDKIEEPEMLEAMDGEDDGERGQ